MKNIKAYAWSVSGLNGFLNTAKDFIWYIYINDWIHLLKSPPNPKKVLKKKKNQRIF